jgi:hypothetical protein
MRSSRGPSYTDTPVLPQTPLTLSLGICFMFLEGLSGTVPFHARSCGAQGSRWAGGKGRGGQGLQETQSTGRKPCPQGAGFLRCWKLRGQGRHPSPLPWAPGAPRGPGRRCRNRCRGVSPGLNDSELRPTGNLELSFRRCPPARVSSCRQRELWARRMGAGEGDPGRGTCRRWRQRHAWRGWLSRGAHR